MGGAGGTRLQQDTWDAPPRDPGELGPAALSAGQEAGLSTRGAADGAGSPLAYRVFSRCPRRDRAGRGQRRGRGAPGLRRGARHGPTSPIAGWLQGPKRSAWLRSWGAGGTRWEWQGHSQWVRGQRRPRGSAGSLLPPALRATELHILRRLPVTPPPGLTARLGPVPPAPGSPVGIWAERRQSSSRQWRTLMVAAGPGDSGAGQRRAPRRLSPGFRKPGGRRSYRARGLRNRPLKGGVTTLRVKF